MSLTVGSFKIIISLSIISYSSPLMILPTFLFMMVLFMIKEYVINSQNHSQRMESITKSPINTRFSSVASGLITIRAYKQEEMFENMIFKDADTNSDAAFTYMSCFRYMLVFIDILNVIYILIVIIFISIMRGNNQISVVVASLAVQMSIDITNYSSKVLQLLSSIENYFTSAQRIMNYHKLENEGEFVVEGDPTDEEWP